MKASKLKIDNRTDKSYNSSSLGIQTIGKRNDYYQRLKEITRASGTATSCLQIKKKFVNGKGFADEIGNIVVNRLGHTLNYIRSQATNDICDYGGSALHFNFNQNYRISEIFHVPFEFCRFSKADPDTGFFNKIAIHPDWGLRNISIRRFNPSDIQFVNLFNINNLQTEIVNGIKNYKGQILYYSQLGEKIYPIPHYDSVITDMSSEEGVSNVMNRNIRNNFLPSGMLVDLCNESPVIDDERAKGMPRDTNEDDSFLQFQGDTEACKIMKVTVKSKEEIPEYIPFNSKNYDKEFTVTDKAVTEKIGKNFLQPPILRSEDVGGNFGSDLMTNAYKFYNSVTDTERIEVKNIFESFLKYTEFFYNKQATCDVIPLTYESENSIADRLGDEQLKVILGIITDATLSVDQKRAFIQNLFGLSDEEINSLIK